MLTSILRLLGIQLLLLFLPSFLVLLLLAQGIFLKITFTHNFRLTERYENSLEISWLTLTQIWQVKNLSSWLSLSFPSHQFLIPPFQRMAGLGECWLSMAKPWLECPAPLLLSTTTLRPTKKKRRVMLFLAFGMPSQRSGAMCVPGELCGPTLCHVFKGWTALSEMRVFHSKSKKLINNNQCVIHKLIKF